MTPALSPSSGMVGGALMVAAMDVPAEQDDRFNAWYTHEHLPERLAVPGMLSARRYVRSPRTSGPGLRYLTMYEAADVEVLTSSAYLRQLDEPTPLTRAVVLGRTSSGSATRRAVLSLLASHGTAVGRQMVHVDLPPDDPDVAAWALRALVPRLLTAWEVCAVHVAALDVAATDSKQGTADGRAFGTTARAAGLALIVEGTHRVAELVLERAPEHPRTSGAWQAALRDGTAYDLLVAQLAPTRRAGSSHRDRSRVGHEPLSPATWSERSS